MQPVNVDCVWKNNGIYCIIENEAIDAAIHIVDIEIPPNEVTLWGPSRIHAEGQYCFLIEFYSRRVLVCRESLPEMVHEERHHRTVIVKRFGYTEDDLRPYIAYWGL